MGCETDEAAVAFVAAAGAPAIAAAAFVAGCAALTIGVATWVSPSRPAADALPARRSGASAHASAQPKPRLAILAGAQARNLGCGA